MTPTPRTSLHAFTEAFSETQKQAHSSAHRKLGKKSWTDTVGVSLKKKNHPDGSIVYRIDKNSQETGRPGEQMAAISAGGAARAEMRAGGWEGPEIKACGTWLRS